jgi:hypothetical protein
MRIDMRLFKIFGIISFILSSYIITVFLNYWRLPLILMTLGFMTYMINGKKSIYFFAFLLPFLGALPYFDKNGYAFNLMAIPLFYLSGMIVSAVMKGKTFEIAGMWTKYYKWFLVILWVSTIFVILRWSNLFLDLNVIFHDTQVSPEGARLSFAIIYPVITLFLFSVSPFITFLIMDEGIEEEKLWYILTGGFFISVTISAYQKFLHSSFMSAPITEFWGSKPHQFNGGFSDFNGYGFFSGILFLYFFISLIFLFVKKEKQTKKFIFNFSGIFLSLTGIYFSASRTALFFVIIGNLYLMFI